MSTTVSLVPDALARLKALVAANPEIDWRLVSFADSTLLDRLKLHGDAGETLIPLLKAYQRLLRVLPLGEERCALPLLQAGFHSALTIAAVAPLEFSRRWNELFPNEPDLGRHVHHNAVARRSHIALKHIDILQSNERHYRAARFR
jgi:hypothetical protein